MTTLCTSGPNNTPCLNGGTPTGTLLANDCQCSCINGYTGSGCAVLPDCTVGANGLPCSNGGQSIGKIGSCSC